MTSSIPSDFCDDYEDTAAYDPWEESDRAYEWARDQYEIYKDEILIPEPEDNQ